MNLSDPRDFARLTQDNASSILNLFTGNGGVVWDIDEACYGHGSTLIKFHIFKSPADYQAGLNRVEDRAGRRKAIYSFPYRDGQTTDDLGAKGQEFQIETLFHGPKYKTGVQLLVKELNDPRPGDFIHPVFGKIRVVPIAWETTHSSDTSQAATMRITFTTHDFDISFQQAETVIPKTFKSAITSAVAFFAKINNILNKIDSNILAARNIIAILKNVINSYKTDYGNTLVRLNATFNRDGSSADIPALNPTNTGGIFPVAASLSSVLQSIPDDVITTEISAALSTQQAIDSVISLRQSLQATIDIMLLNDGGTIFRDEILELKRSAIAVQRTLELGIQSSQSQVINYTVPRLMSLREVAFLNGLSLDRVYDLEILNSSLLSTNYIEEGTVLKVLVSG